MDDEPSVVAFLHINLAYLQKKKAETPCELLADSPRLQHNVVVVSNFCKTKASRPIFELIRLTIYANN